MSVPMALVDFVPVVLFILAAIRLQRGLYPKMSKGAFALFSAGTIMIACAGTMKALWKLLYALDLCDFERLNQSFFPMQSIGFLLAGLAVAALLFAKQESNAEKLYAAGLPFLLLAAPAVYSGTFVFVALMVLGAAGLCGGLAVFAGRNGKKKCIPLFLLAFVFMLMMGYLSSRDFEKASMNWIAEGVNCIGQLLLLTGSAWLFKE